MNAAFGTELAKVRPGWEMGGVDAVLEYWLHDMNDLKGLLMDPDWAGIAVKNENQWCDLSRSTVHLGFAKVYLEDGEILKAPK